MPTQSATSRPAAAVVAVTPLVLITAFVLHPHLPGRQPNIEALAQAVWSDPTRWGLVHLAIGLGSALLAVAFLMISNYLRRAGEDRWSAAGLPLIIVGCTLYAMLPAMEFAPLAAVESGGDPAAAQRALFDWIRPMLIASGIIFGAGAVFFAVSITRSAALGRAATRLVAGALVIMALSRFVPLSAVQFYVQGLACYAAMLPLAYAMWRPSASARVSRVVSQPTATGPGVG
jgi:hypothetical protein